MGVTAWALSSFEPVSHVRTLVLPFEQFRQLASAHLLDRGHRHIGYVVPSSMATPRRSILARAVAGLRSAVEPAGGRLTEIVADMTAEDASAAVDAFLQLPDRPTALYSFRDDYSFPLLKALLARGLCIPQVLAVIGTDNSPF